MTRRVFFFFFLNRVSWIFRSFFGQFIQGYVFSSLIKEIYLCRRKQTQSYFLYLTGGNLYKNYIPRKWILKEMHAYAFQTRFYFVKKLGGKCSIANGLLY